MVEEHRARGYQMPQTDDFVSDFKKLRIDICATASSCDEVDGSDSLGEPTLPLRPSLSLPYLQHVTGEISVHRKWERRRSSRCDYQAGLQPATRRDSTGAWTYPEQEPPEYIKPAPNEESVQQEEDKE